MTRLLGVAIYAQEGKVHVFYRLQVDHPDDERRAMIGSWALARDRENGNVGLYWLDKRFGQAKVIHEGSVREALEMLMKHGKYTWHIVVDPITEGRLRRIIDEGSLAYYLDAGQRGELTIPDDDMKILNVMMNFLKN